MGPLTDRTAPASGVPWRLVRYLMREFLANLGLAFAGLLVLMSVGNVLDELNRVIRYDPSVWAVIAYFACKGPYHAALSAPLAVLLGTLLTVARLLRSHELVAMRAGGMSQYAIGAPILLVSLLVSLLTLAFSETVVPWSYAMRDEIKRVHIRKLPPQEWRTIRQAAVWTPSGKLVYADQADGQEGVLRRVTVIEFSGVKPVSRIDASYARPLKGAWQMKGIQRYRWHRTGAVVHLEDAGIVPVDVGEEDIFQTLPSLEALSLSELKQSIERLKMAGKDSGEEEVFYYSKWSFPFASFIVALLALGISFTFQRNPREGVAKAFGAALIAAITYIGLYKLGEALGVGGVLPPLAAVWMSNAAFFLAGVLMLWRAWRY